MADKVFDGGLRLFTLCLGLLGFMFLMRATLSLF